MTTNSDTRACGARTLRRRGEGGFTLIEITLALLVVSIGLLSIYGVFLSGLNLSQRAIDDTEVALSSDEIIGGLRAKIDGDRLAWDDPEGVTLEAVTYSMWKNPVALEIDATPAGTYRTNIYEQSAATLVNERAIQYSLVFGGAGDSKNARLILRNGAYNRTDTDSFYSEFYDYAMPRP